MLNMRLARPGLLVDINRLPDLDYVRLDGGWLHIGALARQWDVERSPEVLHAQPLLADALGHVGHIQIRTRGTVCGSLAHGHPAAELGAVWACLDGTLLVRSRSGTRLVDTADFFRFYFTTSLEPDEMVVEASLPQLPEGTGWSFQELARRQGDFALVAVACTVRLDGAGDIAEARIALAGVGPVPVRAQAAEAALRGQPPRPEVLAAAAEAVRQQVDPVSDVHASAAYRRHQAGTLTRRALEEAIMRAKTHRGPAAQSPG